MPKWYFVTISQIFFAMSITVVLIVNECSNFDTIYNAKEKKAYFPSAISRNTKSIYCYDVCVLLVFLFRKLPNLEIILYTHFPRLVILHAVCFVMSVLPVYLVHLAQSQFHWFIHSSRVAFLLFKFHFHEIDSFPKVGTNWKRKGLRNKWWHSHYTCVIHRSNKGWQLASVVGRRFAHKTF